MPWVLRDADDDPVRQHLGSARHGAAIAAALADDRRGFAGDGRLVHAGYALDDLAVRGDDVARLADEQIALREQGGRDALLDALDEAARQGVGLRLAHGVGLSLAAPLGHRLGEVREDDREPQPEADLAHEEGVGRVSHRAADPEVRGDRAADLDHEHHRVLRDDARVELDEGFLDGALDDGALEQRARRVLRADAVLHVDIVGDRTRNGHF